MVGNAYRVVGALSAKACGGKEPGMPKDLTGI